MFTVMLLAATLGQVNATDGPPRQWLPGVIGGKTVQIWGWRDVSGGVGYRPQENHHLFPQYAPRPVAPSKPIVPNTGMVLESNGTLNSGLNLQGVRPMVGLDTEDPELLRRLSSDGEGPCPGPGPCPNPSPDRPDLSPFVPTISPFARLEPYAVPIACLVSGVILIAFAKSKS